MGLKIELDRNHERREYTNQKSIAKFNVQKMGR